MIALGSASITMDWVDSADRVDSAGMVGRLPGLCQTGRIAICSW